MTEYAPFIDKMYVIGEEIDVFYNKKDLIKKISFYLDNELERNRIALNGMERALKDYNYNVSLNKIINFIESIKFKKNKEIELNPILKNSIFIKNYTTLRVHYFLEFLFIGRFSYAKEEFILVLKNKTLNYKFFNKAFLTIILEKIKFLKFLLQIKQVLKR